MIVIASTVPEVESILLNAFQQYAPPDSYCMPNDSQAQYATTAACWFPQMDQLIKLPQMKLIHSMAAGVEHLDLNLLSDDYHVCRIVDEHHKDGMLNYLHWGILYYQRYFDAYLENQKKHIWYQYPQLKASDISVGIMGIGKLGSFVGQRLSDMGYQVFGWSKTAKNLTDMRCFSGQDEFDEFLQNTQILINLLPLTSETTQILSAKTFKKLPRGAAIINSGRGSHLNANDLMEYIQSGHLRGAILDVFPDEPLNSGNVLWGANKVIITPHIASHASLKIVVEQILENDKRVMINAPLINEIDINRGY